MRGATMPGEENLERRAVQESLGLTPAPRPRLLLAEVTADEGGRTRVQVMLEHDGRRYTGRAGGLEDELRLTAEATLSAVGEVIRLPGHFRVVGAERIQAFDSPAVLVSVRTTDDRSLRLLGCVPAETDLVGSVARAVLKATNRLVEGILAEENAL